MSTISLNSLQTFETAARHKSYSLAAQELNITHSAVSQQMRGLEQALGVALFERKSRQMQLTADGAQLLKQIQPALRQIARALGQIQTEKRSPGIKVATLQSFATFWLLPRLGKFQALHPDLPIHIQAAIGLVNLEKTKTDIAIRFGLGKWDGYDAEKLLDDQLYPVCSPNFNQGRFPRTPQQLLKHRILCVEHGREWQNWGHHAGIDIHQFKLESHLSDSNLMLTAAMAGQGIAVARHSLVAAEIAAGNLLRLFDIVAPSDYSYYLVTPIGLQKSDDLQAFADWLKKEAKAFVRSSKRVL
ncbi:transcriptional regulator GcvA [Undibacterium sp. LX40W]|uniref:Transcriptional regulator GcvA n=1 Tax=Undibacterium nitidum TaxID=2762298 RepID=A0A923HT49_9BURK|nr:MULTISPECIES: transcriptional regulator GcvA [Undibacterium]MBC3880689.1 transcriptional regulator GcvA [Undibacterium nitidum]MBC3890576.1 transcriptional regulator GcvA [Undibacterium sp. LX40W]